MLLQMSKLFKEGSHTNLCELGAGDLSHFQGQEPTVLMINTNNKTALESVHNWTENATLKLVTRSQYPRYIKLTEGVQDTDFWKTPNWFFHSCLQSFLIVSISCFFNNSECLKQNLILIQYNSFGSKIHSIQKVVCGWNKKCWCNSQLLIYSNCYIDLFLGHYF